MATITIKLQKEPVREGVKNYFYVHKSVDLLPPGFTDMSVKGRCFLFYCLMNAEYPM